jgi:hypothetical protein
MANKNEIIKDGEDIVWFIPEYHKHERGRNWYIAAIGIASVFMLYSFWTGNFLFAIIIIITSIIYILTENEKSIMVKIKLNEEGVTVGQNFFDYDEFEDFAVVYKPKQDIKKLYFVFKNPIKQRLSINLENMNPLQIRKRLLNYLPEDLERTDETLSESLARIFKL